MDLDNLIAQEDIDVNIQYWDAHCQLRIHSSNPQDYIDCEGYRNIIEMGKPALPFIYDAVKTGKFDGEFGWRNHLGRLIGDIVGDEFNIPEEIMGKFDEVRRYNIDWLKDYVSKLE